MMFTRMQRMAIGFTEIVDGLVSVFSFGSFRTNWSFKSTAFFQIKNLKKEKLVRDIGHE